VNTKNTGYWSGAGRPKYGTCVVIGLSEIPFELAGLYRFRTYGHIPDMAMVEQDYLPMGSIRSAMVAQIPV